MTALSDFKATVQGIYTKYDMYISSLGKFLLALVSFLLINSRLGYLSALNNVFLILILALFCSFLSANAIVLFGSAMILGHLYGLSLAALIAGGGIVIILLLLYFGVCAKESYALIFTILTLAFKVPCVVPVVLGLVATPFSIIPVCFGTIAYYALKSINDLHAGGGSVAVTADTKTQSLAIIDELQKYLKGVLEEPELVLMIVLLAAVLIIVFVVRRMAIKYAWRAAVILGTLTYLVIYVVGSLMLGIGEGLAWSVIGSLAAVVVGLTVEFFLFQVDYKRSTSVQFEDDDYYYYVKAIPKIKKGSEQSGEH